MELFPNHFKVGFSPKLMKSVYIQFVTVYITSTNNNHKTFPSRYGAIYCQYSIISIRCFSFPFILKRAEVGVFSLVSIVADLWLAWQTVRCFPESRPGFSLIFAELRHCKNRSLRRQPGQRRGYRFVFLNIDYVGKLMHPATSSRLYLSAMLLYINQ